MRCGRPLTTRTLLAFFALSFGLAWGILGLLIVDQAGVEAAVGPIHNAHPLFVLAVYAPGIAGLGLVWRHHGLAGLGRFLRRLAMGRMPAAWWLLLLLGMPAVFYAGAALKGTLGDPFPFSPWTAVLPALAAALVIGPIEEFGWRGLALPLLQRRMAPFWAALLLGAVWALWHLPAFAISGTLRSAWSFPAFFVGVVALSIIVTPMFNAARGSLLVAVLFHFQANGPAWPDAQPWDTLLFAAAAAGVVWWQRRAMFSRDGAVTEVVPPAGPAQTA